jgi:energy-coupling factor transporter ATP-binding protein EcfA2
MFIELIGPPGSGKTTVAALLDLQLSSRTTLPLVSSGDLARLDKTMGDHYVKRAGPVLRVLLLLRLLIQYPLVVGAILALAAVHGPNRKERYRRARRLLGHLLLLARLRRVAKSSVIILDDGFVQRLWSMLIESKELRAEALIRVALERYCAMIRPLCITLVIDDAATTDRVFRRKSRGRFNEGTGADRRHEFNRWLEYHRSIVALLPPHVIAASVDADGTPDEVAQRLSRVVSHLAGCRHAA